MVCHPAGGVSSFPSRCGISTRGRTGDALLAARGLGDEAAFFAVRSSAVEEDGAEHSFAGQLSWTTSFRPSDRLLEKVEAVWRSGFSERILAYRREQGLPESSSAPPPCSCSA
ncbi:MAG: PEP/pyruvate-binding domain-containing protein [Opitutaceae bacterium]